MDTVRILNLALRFALEVGALVALAYWGFHTGDSTGADLLLGLGAPLVAAVVWLLFIAPKARFPVRLLVRAALEILVFLAAVIALASAGQTRLAVAFACAAIVSELLLYGLGEPGFVERRA